jgi:hypothetical protein
MDFFQGLASSFPELSDQTEYVELALCDNATSLEKIINSIRGLLPK